MMAKPREMILGVITCASVHLFLMLTGDIIKEEKAKKHTIVPIEAGKKSKA